MKHISFSLLLILSSLLTSCNFISFEKLYVTCNVNEEIGYFNEKYIILGFSILPDKKYIEKNVNLNIGTEKIECDYIWNNMSCFVKPKNNWAPGSFYDLNISDALLMADGRFYTVDIKRRFYYGDKAKFLSLISCSVKDNSVVEANTQLEFIFDSPVDIISFKNDFAITPSVAFNIDFIENNTRVVIIPTDLWKTNTYYEWSMEDTKSVIGYPLNKKVSGNFYAPIDRDAPKVVGVYPVKSNLISYTWKKDLLMTDLYITDSIGLEFSEPIDFDSLNNALSFSPSIDGTLISGNSQQTEFIWKINSKLKNDKKYKLTISRSLVDKNKIPLFEDYVLYFMPNGSLYNITSINMNETNISNINDEKVNSILLDEKQNLKLYVTFNRDIKDTYKNVVYDNLNMNSYFPTTASSPSVLSVIWETNSKIVIEYKNFSKSLPPQSNYYLLKILGGNTVILDDDGNYLENEACVYFTVQ